MEETSTRLYGYPISGFGRIVMEFDESGWRVVEDTRSEGSVGGYLHIGQIEDGDISAKEVTEKVRNVMVKYFFYHGSLAIDDPQRKKIRPLGATPQKQYMSELSTDEREAIGNDGDREFYA